MVEEHPIDGALARMVPTGPTPLRPSQAAAAGPAPTPPIPGGGGVPAAPAGSPRWVRPRSATTPAAPAPPLPVGGRPSRIRQTLKKAALALVAIGGVTALMTDRPPLPPRVETTLEASLVRGPAAAIGFNAVGQALGDAHAKAFRHYATFYQSRATAIEALCDDLSTATLGALAGTRSHYYRDGLSRALASSLARCGDTARLTQLYGLLATTRYADRDAGTLTVSLHLTAERIARTLAAADSADEATWLRRAEQHRLARVTAPFQGRDETDALRRDAALLERQLLGHLAAMDGLEARASQRVITATLHHRPVAHR